MRSEPVPMIAEFSSRRFRAWDFTVSHGSLLIRSPRGDSHLDNEDIYFVGVEFMSIPRAFDGLEVAIGGEADLLAIAPHAGSFSRETKMFLLRSRDRTSVVVAARCSVSRSDCDIFEVPWRAGHRPSEPARDSTVSHDQRCRQPWTEDTSSLPSTVSSWEAGRRGGLIRENGRGGDSV